MDYWALISRPKLKTPELYNISRIMYKYSLKYIIITLTLVCLCTLGLSWEGELNPTEFEKWETVRELKGNNADAMWLIAKNPDEFSPIYFVVLIYRAEYLKGKYGEVKREIILVEYRYFKHGEPYVFNYDRIEEKYWKLAIPDWKRKQCLHCHKQKAKSEEI